MEATSRLTSITEPLKTNESLMKNLIWAAGSVVVSVLLAVLIAGGMHGDVNQNVGAITSPSTNMDYLVLSQALGFGNTGSSPNVNIAGPRTAFTAATTTPCAIQNPLNATSTIVAFSMNVTTGPAAAANIVVGTSTSAFGTSTGMLSSTVNTGAQATLTWDPPVNAGVIAPNAWIVAGTNGTGATTIGGSCNAIFVSDN